MLKSAILQKLSLLMGSVFLVIGIFLPSSAIAGTLLPSGVTIANDLLFGATLFRISLSLLGISMVVLGRLPIWKLAEEEHRGPAVPYDRLTLFALAAILFVGTALRLYDLNAGLWLDEILTEVFFAKLPLGSILVSFESENQHFLYSLLAHVSLTIFGDTAWALRLPAVLFGVASIAALFLLGAEVANRTEGLLAASLLTLSYTHIWFSQNARGYSGLLFWTLLSSWLLLRSIRRKRPQLWLLYAVAVALGVYTHVTMLFVVLGQFTVYLWHVITDRGERRLNMKPGFFLGFCFAGLLTLQLYALVLPQVLGGMGREVSVVAEWKNPLWTVLEIVRGMQVSFAGGVVAIGALVVFGAGFLSFVRTKFDVILLLLVPALVGAVVVIGMGHHLWPRFFFFAMGFGVLVVIRGAMQFGRLGQKLLRMPEAMSVRIGTVLCVGLILASAMSIPSVYGPKQDYEGALDFVEERQQVGDVVVTAGLAGFPYQSYYQKSWEEVETVASLDAIRARASRTWLIYTFPTVLEATSPEVKASVVRDFQLMKQFSGTVGDGDIFVYLYDKSMSKAASQ